MPTMKVSDGLLEADGDEETDDDRRDVNEEAPASGLLSADALATAPVAVVSVGPARVVPGESRRRRSVGLLPQS